MSTEKHTETSKQQRQTSRSGLCDERPVLLSQFQVRSQKMTKKAIKDLPEKKNAKESELKELKEEDLAMVTGGVGVIGGTATTNQLSVNVE